MRPASELLDVGLAVYRAKDRAAEKGNHWQGPLHLVEIQWALPAVQRERPPSIITVGLSRCSSSLMALSLTRIRSQRVCRLSWKTPDWIAHRHE